MIFDDRICALGEGPLWHPLRQQLFWFDIIGQRLLTRIGDGPEEWHFTEMVSAAGWITRDELLIASETALFRFNLETGVQTHLIALEADNPKTRSNDGRSDPQGGFWIGTMGKVEGPGTPAMGAIYRYYRGELRKLFAPIAIPNSISFPPGGQSACFTDTVTGRVLRVTLDADGWPKGQPETFLDLTALGLHPDGAVFDADGIFWGAQWGASRVAAYAPDGTFLRAVPFDAPHTSCPAFGGDTLYCTTALHNMDAAARAKHPNAGKTFMAKGIAQGQPEHQVTL
ncbi:SMP-30/gluconolactonase/LRE family protein [Tabrizicola sp. BL-A-41-H6]|uniref:SMP-30/gluconolactonase/LRE family protein n=1 Tax=Tabrizicola sp. BL-A-41-H6 TaxID=3421107 RepID=UPI003D677D46